ncbi:tRNA synthetases class I (C) catalytic domain-containing protein [Aspergillus aurantiobrunneus]
MDSRELPAWEQPPAHSSSRLPSLVVWNSLTRSKTPFIPVDPAGRRVTWYACGPTVYDDAQLGDVRNYVSTDILRRIMKDYFQFDVRFVMNITDVDDKIIRRGRQQHLFAEYLEERPIVTRDVLHTAQVYGGVLRGGALDPKGKPGDTEAKIRMHIKTVTPAARMIASMSNRDDAFYDETREFYLPYIDSLGGSTVPGDAYDIFTQVTQKYEDHLMRDMRALNVFDPDEITRVTEYGQEISGFVEKIVANKFGYQFEKAGHHYARLEPWNRNNKPLQRDGEGALARVVQKRSPDDFALWKATRSGEPSWPSAWGPGRPGWHIECSAMASSRLGSQIDINSGGVDLAFPHHDNELAQREAYWSNHQQWVNYFFHMGHLSIQGLKLRDALDRGDWTPRGLRIVFLLGGWRDGVEISEELVKTSSSWEDKLTNSFIKAKDVFVARDNVHEYFCDSFNTPRVMGAISDLVSVFNSQDIRTLDPTVAGAVARWVTRIVTILGLNGTSSPDSASIGWEGIDVPDAAKPFLYPLSAMRDSLRRAAKSETQISCDGLQRIMEQSAVNGDVSDSSRSYAEILDSFQSTVSSLNPGEATISKETLSLDILQAREELIQQAMQKQQEKEKQEKLARERLEKGKLSPLDTFKTNEFTAWDRDGLRTKDAAGDAVNKSRSKKPWKDWERQKKAHEAWLAANT